jgi:hypothetical protein
MRRIAALTIAATLLAPPALAAPTCWDTQGRTVRCGTEGALPVGTRLTPEQEAQRIARLAGPPPLALAGLVFLLGGLFALIALMPDFDGWDTRR